MNTSAIWMALLMGGAAAFGALPAAAQGYPSKPVRVIVPFPPGGGTDIMGRTMAEKLSTRLGQQFVVDNRSGAGGALGTELAAKAAPDGYTLLMSSSSALVIGPNLVRRPPYDSLRDFAPVILISSAPNVLVVHPSVPARSVKELIALAKRRPGELNYASNGVGTLSHLTGELFKLRGGIDMLHVPYKGGPQAQTDLIGGQIQVQFDVIATALPHIKSGKTRALGVSSVKRSTILPDMPTIAETVPGFNMVGWQGFLVPAGTAGGIVQRLHRDIVAVFALPDVRQRMVELAYETVASSPREFAEFIRTETAQFAKIMAGAGLRPG